MVALDVEQVRAADGLLAAGAAAVPQCNADVHIGSGPQTRDEARRVERSQRGDEPPSHVVSAGGPAHVEVPVGTWGFACEHPQIGEQVIAGVLLTPAHSHASGVSRVRYSNSPLSSGTCSG